MKLRTHIILVITLLVSSIAIANSTISTKLNNNKIDFGETLQITYIVNNENDNNKPDFSALEKNFNVLGTAHHSQIMVINGKSTTQSKWILSVTPKNTGNLVIPAVKIGDATSNELTVEVRTPSNYKDNGEYKDIFVKAEVANTSPYVQSQVLYSLKLFYNQNIQNGQFIEPQVDNAAVYMIGRDKSYQTKLKGERYQVLERHYAIIPEKPGQLIINGPVFAGNVEAPVRSSNSYFVQPWKSVRVGANSVNLNVKPIPATVKDHWWLPSSSVKLSETWSEPLNQLKLGEPVTRTITIEAKGLRAEQLPELDLNNLTGMQVYPDKPKLETTTDGNTLIAKRIEKFALIPNQSGNISIPEIKVNWWNTQTNKLVTAKLPAQKLSIAPGEQASNSNTTPTPEAKIENTRKLENPKATVNQTVEPIRKNNFWIWISCGFALAWILTLFMWRRSKNNSAEQIQAVQVKQAKQANKSQAKQAVKSACLTNDAQATKSALLIWAKHLWPEQVFHNLNDLEKHAISEVCIQALRELDKHLYTNQQVKWDGKSFWQIIENEFAKKSKSKNNPGDDDPLPELYPQ